MTSSETVSHDSRDVRPEDGPVVRELVYRVLREHGLSPAPGSTDADLEDLQASYQSRGGLFRVLVDADGTIVGCGALRRLDAEQCELRKMYLLPEARGRGLGRKLLAELLDAARDAGYQRVRLETATVLANAVRLYERNGFRPDPEADLSARCDQAWVLDLQRE